MKTQLDNYLSLEMYGNLRKKLLQSKVRNLKKLEISLLNLKGKGKKFRDSSNKKRIKRFSYKKM